MKLPEDPRLETDRLIVRLVEKGDLAALFSVNGDEEVVRYLPYESWKTPADGEAWLTRMMSYQKDGASLQFVIVLRESGRPIGTLLLFHLDEKVGSGEIGYVLARAHWNQGIMREALKPFLDFCFETVGLKRLEARLDPRNAASARVLERAGFAREGLQRRNHFAKGELADTGLYGLLREDPRG